MHDVLAPRGPDGEGLWFADDGRVALSHRRLSIIDLSEGGAQPMASADGSLRITYNGEIYNYRELRDGLIADGVSFRADSDTEVLLHLYARMGPEMVRALRGMFAFAIRDEEKEVCSSPAIHTASSRSISPMTARPSRWRRRSAPFWPAAESTPNRTRRDMRVFLFGSVPEPHSLYRGIEALPAGCTVWIDEEGRAPVRRYFDISQELADAAAAPFDRYALHTALRDTVCHHLIADVEVGVFLSSGLDSATLVALASEQAAALRTVTLGFDAFRGTPDDEVPWRSRSQRSTGRHTKRAG